MSSKRRVTSGAQPNLPSGEPAPSSTTTPPDAPPAAAKAEKDPSQIERANRLAREREEGERDGHIAGMCEAAAMALARATADRTEDNTQWACATERLADEYLVELRRRYGSLEHERVRHHMRLRGLEAHAEDMRHRGII